MKLTLPCPAPLRSALLVLASACTLAPFTAQAQALPPVWAKHVLAAPYIAGDFVKEGIVAMPDGGVAAVGRTFLAHNDPAQARFKTRVCLRPVTPAAGSPSMGGRVTLVDFTPPPAHHFEGMGLDVNGTALASNLLVAYTDTEFDPATGTVLSRKAVLQRLNGNTQIPNGQLVFDALSLGLPPTANVWAGQVRFVTPTSAVVALGSEDRLIVARVDLPAASGLMITPLLTWAPTPSGMPQGIRWHIVPPAMVMRPVEDTNGFLNDVTYLPHTFAKVTASTASNDVFVVGQARDPINLDDIVAMRVSLLTGTVTWGQELDNSSADDIPYGLAAAQDNLYIAGAFNGSPVLECLLPSGALRQVGGIPGPGPLFPTLTQLLDVEVIPGSGTVPTRLLLAGQGALGCAAVEAYQHPANLVGSVTASTPAIANIRAPRMGSAIDITLGTTGLAYVASHTEVAGVQAMLASRLSFPAMTTVDSTPSPREKAPAAIVRSAVSAGNVFLAGHGEPNWNSGGPTLYSETLACFRP